ncbi:MAG: hypothetical protein V1662_04300 [Candidatus Omnitrophota bacterium]
MEYKKYRVKSPVKSFRDLEVYKRTTQYAAEIFQIKLPKADAALQEEFGILNQIVKQAPKLIAESYGDKFSDFTGALAKLEKTAQIISNAVTKIDFLVLSVQDTGVKETLNALLKKYQTQRVKVLNLKRAWVRVFGSDGKGRH